MTYEPDSVQRAIVVDLCARLVTETQKLDDILLRQKLTLTLNLFKEQLAGKVRPRRAMALVRRPTTAQCFRSADDGHDPDGAA